MCVVLFFRRNKSGQEMVHLLGSYPSAPEGFVLFNQHKVFAIQSNQNAVSMRVDS